MKLARKNLLEEKREHKRLNLGLFVLGLLVLFLLFSGRKMVQLGTFFPWEEKIKKPVTNQSFKEKLIDLLVKKNIKVVKIRTFQNKIEVILKDGPLVIFDEKDLEKKVTSLQAILERFKIEGRKVRVIDLRFSKPVIK